MLHRRRSANREANWGDYYAMIELGRWLARDGVTTSPQGHGGWCKYPFGAVKFTPAFHSSSVTDDSGGPIYLGEAAGVIIQVKDKVVFHAGDTALFSDMKLIAEDVPIDLALAAGKRGRRYRFCSQERVWRCEGTHRTVWTCTRQGPKLQPYDPKSFTLPLRVILTEGHAVAAKSILSSIFSSQGLRFSSFLAFAARSLRSRG